MSIQLHLDEEDFSLVLDALQHVQSEPAMALANRLLTHYSPSPHLEDDQVGGRQYAGGCALSGSKGSHRMRPYTQSVPFTPTDQNHDTRRARDSCPRNSRNLAMRGRWTIGENTARSSNVSAEAFIGAIAAMDTGLQSDLSQWIESIRSVASEIQLPGATIASLASRCRVLGAKGVGWSVMSMVNYIQLAIKCQRCVSNVRLSFIIDNRLCISMIGSSTSYSDLYEILPADKPTIRTFLLWIASGFKFMHLAAGGSFYLLILVAAKDLRWTVTKMQANVPWEIAKMMRRPNACSKSHPYSGNWSLLKNWEQRVI
jgi:hypothetical protein